MSYKIGDRIYETVSSPGSGSFTLGGIPSGTKFRAFSDVASNGDKVYYAAFHSTNGTPQWEIGIGTWNTGPTMTRSTIIASSNSGSVVTFSSGSVHVMLSIPANRLIHWPGDDASPMLPAITVTEVTDTPSADQNNYSPSGWDDTWPSKATHLRINSSASIRITGLVGGIQGRIAKISNVTTDFLVIIPSQSSSSTAANRFSMVGPQFLMPGESAEFIYDSTASRWILVAVGRENGPVKCLDTFSDFYGSPTTTGEPFISNNSGTGAAVASSSYLSTSATGAKALGSWSISTGTTTTGRASIMTTQVAGITPTFGPALFIGRVAVETATDGTNTYALRIGFQNGSSQTSGAPTNGVWWEYNWSGSVAQWQVASGNTGNAGTVSKSSPGSAPAVDTNYHWVGIFMNANWTRADFFFSDDGLVWTFAGTKSTNMPGTSSTFQVAATIGKTASTTARLADVDLMGWRYDYARG